MGWEDFYREVGSYVLYQTYKKENYLCLCKYCGLIWIEIDINRCPFCNSGNIKPIPLRDCSQLTISWLKKNFCEYFEEVLNAEKK